jgi:hypothetical protein
MRGAVFTLDPSADNGPTDGKRLGVEQRGAVKQSGWVFRQARRPMRQGAAITRTQHG